MATNPEYVFGFKAAVNAIAKEGNFREVDWSSAWEYLDAEFAKLVAPEPCTPIPMRLPCPSCGKLHIDEGEFATKLHHTHACQYCGMVWRPAVPPTIGVQFLPGFKNAEPAP